MASMKYDPAWVRDYYDAYGMKEWERWERGPAMRIAFAVHAHYLRRYIQPGQRILEIGAGAGRFTQVLAEIGARITVADISPGQLALNRQQAEALGFAHAVEGWVECDACDLHAHFADQQFDTVVAYGGLLSYVYDQTGPVLTEFQRVVKPGGDIFLEVMSLWGAIHHFLPDITIIPPEKNRRIVATGDLHREMGVSNHYCHMYRAGEFRRVLEAAGLVVDVLSATEVLSANWDEQLRDLPEDGDTWQHLLELELEACREPGCVDMGTHIIAVCRKSM
ncbi:MAG TPA: methyltransferase domain-containing protein [Armatimonadota bacterium]|jgi:SAM-dependent methyltransferase